MSHFEKFESYIPIDLLSFPNFLLAVGVVYFFIAFRYFAIVGAFYVLVWKKRMFGLRQIYRQLPGPQQIKTEIKWSLLTSVIFAVAGVLIGVLWQLGWTRFYLRFDEYPLWWMPVSMLALALVHEVYFYFTHRLMHHPLVYRRAHHIHHLSLRPSPWASFSFHPIESVLESLILPLLILFIPVHPVVFLSYLTLMTISAIINHLGFEVLPKKSGHHWFWGQWISGTHHGQHHKHFNCNFGLYFTFMDRLFKTEHADYDAELRGPS